MSRKRKQYSSDFKAKVALAALKGNQTTSELAARFESYPTMVSQWKRDLLDNATGVFESKSPLNIRWSRELPGEPSTVTVSKDSAGRYFVSCLCEFTPETLPVTPRITGIDLGLKDLFVTDQGERIDNPRYTAKYAARLAKAQRRLSRKKLGSANRARARKRVACIHAKMSDCRRDRLHTLSRRLIQWKACTRSARGRRIKRYPEDEARLALQQIMTHPGAQAVFRQRKAMAEPVFSALRQQQGLSRFRRRGLAGVKREFALHVMAYNLARAVALSLYRLLWACWRRSGPLVWPGCCPV